MKNLKFIKGTVASVTDKRDNPGIDLLLTPEDIKNLSTGKGYVPISIRIGKDGKPYAYKATRRLAPNKTKDIVDEIHDLARISVEEISEANQDALCQSIYDNHINQTVK